MRFLHAITSRLAIMLAACLACVAPAVAQGLSDQPITLVVPFTAGTGPDTLARIIGEELRARWKQPVVVENKAGASGNIGTQAASRAAPDGHTLMVTVNTFVMNESLFRSLPYDPQKSFVPIAEVATGALAFVVHPSLGATTLVEFEAALKAKPGQINYASPGRGTPQHLAMELFKLTQGLDIKHVPYTGSAGAVKDLLGGHISAMVLPVHTALPLAEAGQIRILAVGSEKRAPQAPNVPTLAELGVKDFDVDLWYGVLAPAGTPEPIVQRYNAALNEILKEEAVRAKLDKQGLVPRGGEPAMLSALIAKDRTRWADVVRRASITPE